MPKARVILLIFGAFFLCILAKLFYIQVIASNTPTSDYLKYQKIYPQRGKIYDRSGNPLALNQREYLLYAEPKKITDKYKFIKGIDDVLKIGEATIEGSLSSKKEWLAIKGNVDEESKKKLESLKIPGIGFDDQFERFYPEASLAAHLLGFVGKTSQGEDTGYFGIEGFYDKDLAGLPGLVKSERDLLGRPIVIGTQDKVEQEDGSDLYLTIDSSVQRIIKDELKAGLERYKATSGCVITADPYTMEILGLACLPDFDLTKYYQFSQDTFKNTAVSSSYEPGSTFKPLVMAAAINEKKIKPTDLFNEKGPIKRSGYTIKTWDDKYEGKITMTRILEKSSNVGMVYVADRLGKKNLVSYIEDYGFGEPTGVDVQGEVPGVLRTPGSWHEIDYATAAFGQGIGVTPIQMITAFSSVVNSGQLLKPTIVKKVVYGDDEKLVKPQVVRNILKPTTSEIMKQMLVSTVAHGEYKWAVPEGYKIGGKTGTAQIPIAGHYDASKTIASFIGFAPADKPKFVTLVVLTEPKTSPWGSETAAPLFFKIAQRLFLYYNIAPTQ